MNTEIVSIRVGWVPKLSGALYHSDDRTLVMANYGQVQREVVLRAATGRGTLHISYGTLVMAYRYSERSCCVPQQGEEIEVWTNTLRLICYDQHVMTNTL